MTQGQGAPETMTPEDVAALRYQLTNWAYLPYEVSMFLAWLEDSLDAQEVV